MKKLVKGDMAPEFKLEDQDGRKVGSCDYPGRKILLFFYPKAGSSG